MRHFALLGLCSLLTLSSVPLAAQAESSNSGNSLAVAIGTDTNGNVQPYTDWGWSRGEARNNALNRCASFSSGDCALKTSWTNSCRWITYTHYEVFVTASRSDALDFCAEEGCVNTVQRCPR